MVTADALVTRLREQAASPFPATPPSTPLAPAGLPPYAGTQPAPPLPPRARRRGLSSASVPVVLLSLGGLCLLVFAAIFLGVAWDVLGLWGRSLVILGVTVVLGASAVAVTVKGLRASAETLWVVTGVMLAFDVYAASAADLVVAALSGRTTTTVAGLALLLLGTGVAVWARRTPARDLVGAQLVALLGILAVSVAQGGTRDHLAAGVATTIGVLLLLAAPLVVLRLRWTAAGTLLLAAGYWGVLVLVGLTRATVAPSESDASWWWPLVAASAYAAAVVLVPVDALPSTLATGSSRRGIDVVRAAAAAAALVPLALVLNAEALTDSATGSALLALLTLLAVCAVLAWSPRTWACGAAPLAFLGSAWLALALLLHLPQELAGTGLADPTAFRSAARVLPTGGPEHPVVWLVAGVTLALAAVALLGLVGPGAATGLAGGRRQPVTPDRLALAATAAVAAVSLGGWTTLLMTGPLLWLGVLGGLLAVTATGWAAWWVREHTMATLVAAGTSLWLAAHVTWLGLVSGAPWLLAVILTSLAVPLAVAGGARDRVGSTRSAVPLLAVGVTCGAGALHAWATWLGGSDHTRALLLASAAALLLLASRALTRLEGSRLTLEVAAGPLTLAAVLLTDSDAVGTQVLTVVGVAAAVAGIRYRDREALTWVAAAVVSAATAWRVGAELPFPELPAVGVGLVLLAAGSWRLRDEPALSSPRALGTGLALVLVPAGLLALSDPVSLRGALVAVAAIVALATGVAARLSAPFVLGATLTALLVLRHLGPVADAVPRWMVIGLIGATLLGAGITWEAGLRNLARARRYVGSLR